MPQGQRGVRSPTPASCTDGDLAKLDPSVPSCLEPSPKPEKQVAPVAERERRDRAADLASEGVPVRVGWNEAPPWCGPLLDWLSSR
jgi:hypothetical protein